MKIRITFKDPDVLSYAKEEFLQDYAREKILQGLSGDARQEEILRVYRPIKALRKNEDPEILERLEEIKAEALQELKALDKWIEFEEYLTVEFDLEKGTARVVEVKE